MPTDTKWYNIYESLAKALFRFQTYCVNLNRRPGEELYKILTNDIEFLKENTWIEKFRERFGVRSIDPLHIYASINAGRAQDNTREERIRILFRLLETTDKITKIDFTGCPAPVAIRILNVRDHKSQDQIWDLFGRVWTQQTNGLQSADFTNFKIWKGVQLSSFTIFLFWVRSDSFLPLDKNTRAFLRSTGIATREPDDYNSYITTVNLIGQQNHQYDTGYGEKGLFRELAALSRDMISAGSVKGRHFSPQMTELIKNLPAPETTEIITSEKLQQEEKLIQEKTGLSNLGFRIIALRPLKECSEKYLNVLQPKKIYYFEKAFTIEKDQIVYAPEKTTTLYNQQYGADDILQINITAVVGKNGSGKSSLVELLFRIINNLAYTKRRIFKTQDLIPEKDFAAELYYMIGGQIFCLIIQNTSILIQEYAYSGSVFKKKTAEPRNFDLTDLKNWFYTIAVNYSHYALNRLQIGDWIQSLFHKNDGYQTPIVLSPMRTNGNIDINVENDLVRSRLMALLFSPVQDSSGTNTRDIGLRQITQKQKAVKVEFEQIRNKNHALFKTIDSKGIEKEIPFTKLRTNKGLIIRLVKEIFQFPKSVRNRPAGLKNETEKYIIRKLVKISMTYAHYAAFFNSTSLKFNEKKLPDYLIALRDDPSHITYKLKQAINYLRYPDLIPTGKNFELNIDNFSKIFESFKSTIADLNLIELLPPPIFKPKIVLIDKKKKESDFEKLSSGEKQLIHSVTSVLYNLQNIDSVHSAPGSLITYRNVNIVLDEIELYYHPEMQRLYLNFLLDKIKKLSLENIDAINIAIITHSPYILSDLPAFSTLKLEDGLPKTDDYKTFGGNVHELLANDFFMENGYMGEWAKQKILSSILYMEERIPPTKKKRNIPDEEWSEEGLRQLISLIGEPLIENSLAQLFEVFKNRKK